MTTSNWSSDLATVIVRQMRRAIRRLGAGPFWRCSRFSETRTRGQARLRSSTVSVATRMVSISTPMLRSTWRAISTVPPSWVEILAAAPSGNCRPVAGGWVHTVLYSFTGSADGGEPYKGVTLDAAGNLYGTAVTGGSGSCEGGCGVVYKLTNSGGTWTQTVIHAFTGADGSGPGSRVTLDNRGNVYGMTPTGGADGLGTIYELHPRSNGSWSFRVIHDFHRRS